MDSILRLGKVSKTYSRKTNGHEQKIYAARRVSFELQTQHIMALVGESGSGKSTIAKLITGVEHADSGVIEFEGKTLSAWRRGHLAEYRRNVQMVFQDPYAALNPLNTVRYTISRPLVNYRKLHGESLHNEIQRLLEVVHLTPVNEFIDKLPFELSGGQLQRVVTARAVASNPKLIVADEPVSMLDVSIRAEILRLIEELRSKQGVTFLYITHDLISARMLADEIVVLYRGTVVETGNARAVAKNPLHPYTQLLLQSIPNPWATEEQPMALGILDRTSDDGGCVFRARCPYAMEVCHQGVPELTNAESDHLVACFLHHDATTQMAVQ